MHLTWPISAKPALAFLFRPLQDVDVYVEDLGDDVFYTELFKRVTPKSVRIARVFTAGNRQKVIEKACAHDFSARKAFFVIDGDFEWVRGEVAPAPGRVYRLDAYCIENLLIHEDAAAKILIEEEVLSEEAAKHTLQLQSWQEEISSHLLDLFIWFAALNAANPDEPTVGTGVGALLTHASRGIPQGLAPAKVSNLAADVQRKTVEALGVEAASALFDSIKNRVLGLPNPTDAISGKDYLLPLFEHHLWKFLRRKTPRKSLRVRLARNCCLERFQDVSKAIARSANGS